MAAIISPEQRQRNLSPNEICENKESSQSIWLDENFDDSTDYLQVQSLLLELNPAVQFYSDFNCCVDLIKSIINERVFLIASYASARSILTQIGAHRTLVAIFIFDVDRHHCEESIKEYEKVIGTFTDHNHLLQSIRETMDLIEKQTLAFNLFDQKQKLGRDLSKDSASFIWHQMLIYVLKKMPHGQQSKEEMLNVCRSYYRTNKKELQKIEEFRVNYTSSKAIEWYTAECFLYKLLNKALRTEDIELLYTFRFFIMDLCTELEEEWVQLKNQTILTTFRGTQIPGEELQKLKENEGKIISTNGFLSTSRNINVALAFAGQSSTLAAFQAVLFEVEIDSSLKTVVFADIRNKTRMKDEDEILFTLNALFKIKTVTFDSALNIWKVKLTATDEGTEEVQDYIISIKQRLDEYPPIIYFGRLLIKELGQMDRAEKYFEMLLKTLPPDHTDIAAAYNQIGNVHDRRCDLNSALKNFQLAYNIAQNQPTLNYPQLAGFLGNMGRIHRDKGNFDEALDCYKQALEIGEKNYPRDHIHTAVVIQNIGIIYSEKNDFDTALTYVFDALEMIKRLLPAQHHYIAKCFGYIGYVYEKKGEFDCALEYYYKLLQMDEHCLPPDHSDCSIDINMIVEIYKTMGKSEEALIFCQKKLIEQKSVLGETHTCVARTLISIADVLRDAKPHEAMDYYRRALTILQKLRLSDYQLISECFTSMSCIYWKVDAIDDALQYELRALNLHRQKLSSDHIKIANSLRNIGIYYRRLTNLAEASRYFTDSLSIYRMNYKPDHEYVKRIQKDIAELNDDFISTDSNEESYNTMIVTTISDRRRPYHIASTLK